MTTKRLFTFLILAFVVYTMNAQLEVVQTQLPAKENLTSTKRQRSEPVVVFEHAFETPAGNDFEVGWTNLPTSGGNAWSREEYWIIEMIQDLAGVTGRYARILAHNNVAHDAWLITPGIPLTQGKMYQISFILTTMGSGNVIEKLELKTGKSPTAAGMTQQLFVSDDAVNYYRTTITVNFTPTDSDDYYIGWHAISAADGHLIYIDDVLVVEVMGDDLENITDYNYSQVPKTQLLPSGKVENIGASTQTNIVLTAKINGATLGTSAPLPSLAPGATAELTLSSSVNVPEGDNAMTYTFTQDQPDSNPENNDATFYYKGTKNLYAVDEVTYLYDFSPVISTTWIAYGNIFTISQPVTISQAHIGFGHPVGMDYSVSLYAMTGDFTTATTPIFTQSAMKDPVYGFACLDLPATLLTPGNYYLCINQPYMDVQMGVVFDGNPNKITYGKDNAGNLTRIWEYGGAAIRMVLEVSECAAPSNLAVIPDYYSAVFSWDGNAPMYKLTLNDGNADYYFYTQDNTITISGMEEGGATTFNWSVTSICDANHNATAVGMPFVTLSCEMVTSFPFEENFDRPTIPSFPPPCWTVHNIEGGERSWDKSAELAHSEPFSAWHICSTVYYQEGLLVTPQLQITSDSYALEFWSANTWVDFHVYGGVWISTTTNEPEAFTEIKQLSGNEISKDWKQITVPLGAYAGKNIYIGFRYAGADGDEWFIDDVRVVNYADFIDGELAAIITPNTGDNLTANEPVKVLIKNNGGDPLTGFTLTLKLDGVVKATETFTNSVPNFGEAEYTFNTTLDLSTYGTYEITVTLDITGDVVPGNNSKTKKIGSFPPEIVKLYGYRTYDDVASPPEGFISFYSHNPANVTILDDYLPPAPATHIYAGEHVDGYFYACTVEVTPYTYFPVNFIKIATDTWTEVAITSISASPIDMAYDYTTNTMYGLYPTDNYHANLVTVNLTTGAMTPVGGVGVLAISLACNPEGKLFAVDQFGSFYSINKTTGAGTLIGSTGVTPWYIQSMAFDQNTGRLFWASRDKKDEGHLMEIDLTTGFIFDRGAIAGNAGVIGLYSIIGELPEQYTVTLLANPATGGTLTGAGNYLAGTPVTVTATPNTNHEFINWTNDNAIVSTTTAFSFTVTEDVELVANFEENVGIALPSPPEERDVRIYPNPTSGLLTITYYRHCVLNLFQDLPQSPENNEIAGQAHNDIHGVEIFDVMGKRALSSPVSPSSPETALDLSRLPSGIYFLRITTGNGTVTRKVVKK
ncbi:MAG: choice-of-anchor J domain-containing protein [Bacteroidales bacterium]|nr:choice-of-anchor J domain-containing protein [Bacteroidales bacterium]